MGKLMAGFLMDKQKLFDLVLKGFLVLSPLFTFKMMQVSSARGLFFIFGSIILFSLSLGLEPKRKFSNVWLSVILFLAMIRVFFDNSIEQIEFFGFWNACSSFIFVFFGVLLFHTVYCFSSGIKQYLKPILIVCAVNLILSLCQFAGHDFVWSSKSYLGKVCGFFETPAQLGQYSALSIPLLFIINPFLSAIPLTLLILSKSVAPITAFVVGIVFIQLAFRKYILALLTVLVISVIAISAKEYIQVKWYTRPIMWEKTLSMAFKKPFLGWGYKSFNDKVVGANVDKVGLRINPRSYNDYFHTAQELGFPVVIAFGVFIYGLFKKLSLLKVKDKDISLLAMAVLIGLVNMFGQNMIRYSSVSSTFIILLALLTVGIEERAQHDKCTNC